MRSTSPRPASSERRTASCSRRRRSGRPNTCSSLVRCSLKSLRFHAARAGVDVPSASGRARTLVTKRETDDRYSLVETELALVVELEPEPDALAELLALAERDCFVGSSLTVAPSYEWTVNGRTIAV